MNRFIKNLIPYTLLLVLLSGCGAEKEVVFEGATMGTTYQVKLITGHFKRTTGLEKKIDRALDEINQSMSTYLPDSEISRFNALQDTRAKLAVSDDFLRVMQTAKDIYKTSGGAWDGTIKPLVDLWGFGSSRQTRQVPDESDIQKQLLQIGFRNIEIFPEGFLQKKKAAISLDLASIAKGYAVDRLSVLLKAFGTENFLVEIGGEVFASGNRKDGTPWRVGINRPSIDASMTDVYHVVPLYNRAMATSGDYRNYFEAEGTLFSHIIDPRTGYPVNNGVVSVSIIAGNCMIADGLATAVMVMGVEAGMALIGSKKDVAGFIIVRTADNELVHYASEGFMAVSR